MIWTNTALFDSLILKKQITKNKEQATFIILGAGDIDITEFPNVKLVYRAGVGTDNINFSNIPVVFPSDSIKELIYEETANFTCFLIFKMLYDHLADLNNWCSKKRHTLKNKKLLIIGAGNIGGRVHSKMIPFIENISIYDIKNGSSPPDYSSADIITVHIPHTQENEGFIDKHILNKCKNNAILINTARGSIFNEDDLYYKLQNSDMRAAFDVFWDEPYSGKLTTLDREKFFITPHMASSNIEFVEGCFDEIKSYYEGSKVF